MMPASHGRGEDVEIVGASREVIVLEDDPPDDNQSNRNNDADIMLTPEQEAIIQAAEDGRNVFITGAAGVGKSKRVNLVCLRGRGK